MAYLEALCTMSAADLSIFQLSGHVSASFPKIGVIFQLVRHLRVFAFALR